MDSTVERARAMRKALTPPEARLWLALKKLRAEGYMIRRQAPHLGYFLDFACSSRKVCIEVDGAHHGSPDQMRHDRRRDAVVAQDGWVTLRFQALDVRDNLDGIVEQIRQTLSQR